MERCTCQKNALACPVHPGGLEREDLKNAAKVELNPEAKRNIEKNAMFFERYGGGPKRLKNLAEEW